MLYVRTHLLMQAIEAAAVRSLCSVYIDCYNSQKKTQTMKSTSIFIGILMEQFLLLLPLVLSLDMDFTFAGRLSEFMIKQIYV